MASSRPTAPKLRLIKDKEGKGSSGIAIRFNASSLLDEDEDEVLLDTTTPSLPEEREAFIPANTLEKVATLSAGSKRQSPSREDVFVSAASSPMQDTDKSLLTGIKERLHDPLTAFMGKIEEISGETGLVEAVDKKLKKSSSLDSTNIEGFLEVNADDKDERNSVDGDEVFIPSSISSKASSHRRKRSIEVVHDFYSDPCDDVTSQKVTPSSERTSFRNVADNTNSSNGNGRSSLSPLHRIKSSKGKDRNSLTDVPVVSMRTLLSTSSQDNEDEFFDPKDDVDYRQQKEIKKQEHEKKSKDSAKNLQDSSSAKTSPKAPQQQVIDTRNASSLSNHFWSYPSYKLATFAMVLLAYVFFPMSPYMAGLVTGCIVGAFGLLLYQWLTPSVQVKHEHYLEPLDELPPIQVPEMRESKNEPGKFKGWLNELSVYDPEDYHISATRSVYVQLEGCNLRLQTPKHNVPKRAMWNEQPLHAASFVHQRFYDLKGSTVFLLPEGLVRKRIWSKKYPICIGLVKNLNQSDKKFVHQGSLDSIRPVEKERDGSDKKSLSSQASLDVDPKVENTAADMGYEMINTASTENILYLFARTSREKEEWYRRLQAASLGTPLPTQMVDLLTKLPNDPPSSSRPSSLTSEKDLAASSSSPMKPSMSQSATDSNLTSLSGGGTETRPSSCPSPGPVLSEDLQLQYLRYMAKLMPTDSLDRFFASATLTKKIMQFSHGLVGESRVEEPAVWLNAVLGRLFWDFLQERSWAEVVKDKIQKKLSKIHVPYFIDNLTVTDIDLGKEIPLIRRISRPYIDDRGLWLDLDVAYGGGFTMSLETKVNLMKLKKPTAGASKDLPTALAEDALEVQFVSTDKKSAVTNSDEEDSAESSTDEEADENLPELPPEERGHSSGNTSKKILRLVDKIAASRYFQQATEYKYIKKAMEEVSNTRLMLKVELRSCVGVMALNVPPPPTDRLWYGFRSKPRLYLSAQPQVGERTISVSHITDWIEKKLAIEFQRVLVFPNMDDLPIPIMCDKLQPDSNQS